ncbi:unnamed protein product [Rotaria magnacalcarata]
MPEVFIQLNDLPDEIFIYILKKLTNLQVLYSLLGVSKRLNRIVYGSILTNHLTLLRSISNDSIYPLSNRMLDRFCLHILPEIHHKIKWLNLESCSIERILRATNYPNLNALGLYNIRQEMNPPCFTDVILSNDTLRKQISFLAIQITDDEESINFSAHIFTKIFTVFTNLKYLNMNESFISQSLSFYISP